MWEACDHILHRIAPFSKLNFFQKFANMYEIFCKFTKYSNWDFKFWPNVAKFWQMCCKSLSNFHRTHFLTELLLLLIFILEWCRSWHPIRKQCKTKTRGPVKPTMRRSARRWDFPFLTVVDGCFHFSIFVLLFPVFPTSLKRPREKTWDSQKVKGNMCRATDTNTKIEHIHSFLHSCPIWWKNWESQKEK